ncbi:MAG: sugar-transfer associated ATP-grasp domain-containing protein [Parvibaculaceae bacterium]
MNQARLWDSWRLDPNAAAERSPVWRILSWCSPAAPAGFRPTTARKPRLSRWEETALLALHAYPVLFRCAKWQVPGTPSAIIFETVHEDLEARLLAMPVWKRVLLTAMWPPAMLGLAIGLTAKNGLSVSRRYHRSVLSQFVGQLNLAFLHGVPVNFFYTYELHEPENRERAHEYVFRGYIKKGAGVFRALYRQSPERSRRAKLLNDKYAFHQFCRQHNLPVPRLIATVEDGGFAWHDTSLRTLPPTSLFVKPRKSNGGTGAERWIYSGGWYSGSNGEALQAAELMEHLARLSRRGPRLVQECLVNHRDIWDLTAGALSTLRMHTIWNERDEVEHLFTMLRMSQYRRRIVDTRDGIAAPVDPETGELGRASNSVMSARWFDHHPSTGALIASRRVPFWNEALELAISTHRQLRAPILIGWDIAITDKGPVIVEANKSPDIEIEQRLDGPWGDARFGQLLAHHLRKGIGPPATSRGH